MKLCKTGGVIVVAALGVACLVFGVMFIMQAGTNEQRVADELDPLKISEVNATYGQVSAALTMAQEPEEIQNLTMQKTSLGLARANIGTVKFLRNSGIVNIIIGTGLLVASGGILKRD